MKNMKDKANFKNLYFIFNNAGSGSSIYASIIYNIEI